MMATEIHADFRSRTGGLDPVVRNKTGYESSLMLDPEPVGKGSGLDCKSSFMSRIQIRNAVESATLTFDGWCRRS